MVFRDSDSNSNEFFEYYLTRLEAEKQKWNFMMTQPAKSIVIYFS